MRDTTTAALVVALTLSAAACGGAGGTPRATARPGEEAGGRPADDKAPVALAVPDPAGGDPARPDPAAGELADALAAAEGARGAAAGSSAAGALAPSATQPPPRGSLCDEVPADALADLMGGEPAITPSADTCTASVANADGTFGFLTATRTPWTDGISLAATVQPFAEELGGTAEPVEGLGEEGWVITDGEDAYAQAVVGDVFVLSLATGLADDRRAAVELTRLVLGG